MKQFRTGYAARKRRQRKQNYSPIQQMKQGKHKNTFMPAQCRSD